MEAQLARFQAAHTQVLGVSVDSVYCHANWARDLGGVSFPLLADFSPKGALAAACGVYLEKAGITDRATVIIDSGGVVRHASSVGPSGQRDVAQPGALYADVVRTELASGDFPLRGEELTWAFDDRLSQHKLSHRTHERQISANRWIQINEHRTDTGGTVVLYTDISELKRREQHIRHMAEHDALTGLPNRVLFRERVHEQRQNVLFRGFHINLAENDGDAHADRFFNALVGHQLVECGHRLRSQRA